MPSFLVIRALFKVTKTFFTTFYNFFNQNITLFEGFILIILSLINVI